MLGTCGDHGFIGDGDSGISCKDLTFLLFPCVDRNGRRLCCHPDQVGSGVDGEGVHDKGVEIDGVETFGRIIKNGVVDIVNRHLKLVVCDGEDHLAGVPCLMGGGVGGVQFLAFGCCGTSWDD